MTLVKNRRTGNWEADIRMPKGAGRLHVSLRKGGPRRGVEGEHAALQKLVDEQHDDVIAGLRRGSITVAAVASCYKDGRPFSALLERASWPTLADAIEEYISWKKAHSDPSKHTVVSMQTTLDRFAEFIGTDRPLESVSYADVEAWKVELAKTTKPTTIRSYLIRVTGLYNWFIERERKKHGVKSRRKQLQVPVDPDILPKKVVGSRKRFLSHQEAQRLLAATPDQLRFPVLAGLHAGLRLDEVCHLRPPPHDLNFELGILNVQSQEGWRPKNKKAREIPMTPELAAAAREHHERWASGMWMMPSPVDETQPFRDKTLAKHFKRIVEDAEFIAGRGHAMGVTFHTLRHTFTSWLIMAGVDLYTVAQLLGHGSVKMIEEVYGHLSPDHKRLAVSRLVGWLGVGSPVPAQEATN